MANIYGYIRVSTKDQNEQRQLHKMMGRGVEARRIFVDKASGRHWVFLPSPKRGIRKT